MKIVYLGRGDVFFRIAPNRNSDLVRYVTLQMIIHNVYLNFSQHCKGHSHIHLDLRKMFVSLV